MTTTVDGGLGPRIVSFVRLRPLTSFLLWFFTVGQAIAFVPVVAAGCDVALPALPFVTASTLVGLLLPAVVVTRVAGRRAGVRAFGRGALAVRAGPGWYALAIVGVPALATTAAAGLLGAPRTGPLVAAAAVWTGFAVPALIGFVTVNWAEEVAWTGFVQARLQARFGSAARAALLTAPLFALQHASLAVGQGPGGLIVLGALAVLAVPFRMLTGWVYNRCGSLVVVGLLHATGNAVAARDGVLSTLYPGGSAVVGSVHLLGFAVAGTAVLVATGGRLGAHGPAQRDGRPDRPCGRAR